MEKSRFWRRNSTRLTAGSLFRAALHDHLFDVAQPILSKEDLVADKEGRRAKSSVIHRSLSVVHQFVLDLSRLDQLEKPAGIELGLGQRFAENLGVVHFLRLGPHMPIHFIDIALEHAERTGGNRATHYHQG